MPTLGPPTTSGLVADGDATQPIHTSLKDKDLLPSTLLDLTLRVIGPVVDTGYLDVKLLMDSRQDYVVDLFGSTRPEYIWQA
jgi:transposase